MNWIELKITTTAEGIEPICDALYDLGITGVQISDKDDFKEFLENNRKYWDYVDEELEKLKEADSCITVYFGEDCEGKALLEAAKEAVLTLKYPETAFHERNVKDEDWSENWKQYFKPLEIGEKVLIVPEWEDVPESDRVKFIINPGMSFGTGSHESTKMCIEEIEKHIKNGDTILDLGCGSGILSVIALLLGAKEATAVDIDPMAVETAYQNLALNNLPKEIYHGFAGDITTDKDLGHKLSKGKSDIVLANIVADVIVALSGYVKDFMKDDGTFICSGIIAERTEEVVDALKKAELKVQNIRTMGEWSAVVCTKI